MLNPIVRKFQYGQHTITLETGIMARQATSAVMASMDDTTVFVTVVGQKKINAEQKFFPLTVNYQERAYAAGRIPGGFFRREGRPSENEILIARLIDRPLRPLFPKGFFNEIQIIITVVSVNPQINPDIISIIGASTALSLSGIPFYGPIGASRVGYLNNQYILNPTSDDMKCSTLDLVVSGTQNAVLMVEAEANIMSEEKILNAILFGHHQQQVVINNIRSLSNEARKLPWIISYPEVNQLLESKIIKISELEISAAYSIFNKQERCEKLNSIKEDLIVFLSSENDNIDIEEIEAIFQKIEKK